MISCPYCAQTRTKKGEGGYCIKYDCFEQSGKQKILNTLLRRSCDLYQIPRNTRGLVSGPISNFYSKRTREANDIMLDAEQQIGFILRKLIKSIPSENQEKWDKNIRW